MKDERYITDITDYLESWTGLRCPPSNLGQVRRVLRRQAARGSISIEDLCRRIPIDPQEREEFLNEVMIGETYFFREAAQFRLLRDRVLPELFRRKKHLTCWSVSCSTGEEPLSIAMLLEDYCSTHRHCSWEIHASDINSASLDRLRSGVYRQSSLRSDGKEFHHLATRQFGVLQDNGTVRLHEKILHRIHVHHLNFFRDSLEVIPGSVDLIFFRNTLLYAAAPQRGAIMDRVVARVADGGAIFMATTELPFVVHRRLHMTLQNGAYFLQVGSGDSVGSVDPGRTGDSPEGEQKREGEQHAPGSPRKASPGSPPSTEAILAVLNAPESLPEGPGTAPDGAAVIAEVISRCFLAISSGQMDRAALLAGECEVLADQTAPGLYCVAWYHHMVGNPRNAEQHFSRVLEKDGSFWPARFYRTIIRTAGDSRLSRGALIQEFRQCIHGIDQDDDTRDRYRFFLEGFSPGYFRHMCTRWIERLNGKEKH